jgi:beta-galactosidase
LIAGTAVPAAGALTGAADARPTAPGHLPGRRTLALRDGWRFALADPGGIIDPTGAYEGAERPDYDDSAHGTASGTGFFPGGLDWCRTAFILPSVFAGKRISVEFDGVYVTPPQRMNPWGFTSTSRLTPDKPCPLPKQAISIQRTAAP